MSSWTRELDEAADLATRTGYWHIVLFYLLCGLAAIPTSFLVFSQVFTNATPGHWCAPQQELDSLGLPEDLLRSLLVPGEHGEYESCRAYTVDTKKLREELKDYVEERTEKIAVKDDIPKVKTSLLMPTAHNETREERILRVREAIHSARSNETSECSNGWRFSTEQYKRTMVTDFLLVCEKEYLPRMSNTLFWVGSIFGNLFFGWMSDKYGRRPTILLMILVEVPLAIAASFSSSYRQYVWLRVAGGLFFPALYQQPFILALELMPPSRRTHAGIVVGVLFASGMCLLSLLAYAIQDWYYLSLATSLPFVLLYGYYWLIPESPRWLVGRGRIADAEKVLRDLAKKNGIVLSRGFLIELHKKIKEEEENTSQELTSLTNMNGHVAYKVVPDKEEHTDRRISNMLTFKPDMTKITETRNSKENLEKIIALEVAEIVNKTTKLKKEDEELKDKDISETSYLNSEQQQKATQTEFPRSPSNTLRRKSMQLVSKIFPQGDENEVLENKRMDDQNSEGDCKASLLDVFRYPNIRKKFFILTFEWIALGVVYNSSSYNTPNLGVNDYLAFFIGGAVEIPSYFIAWWCMERFGRRWVLCIFMCVGGIACISCVLVPESWPWVMVSLSMFGRLFTASSFAVFYVLIGELLPTVLRAQAMGAASFISGLGLLACPYIVHLAVYSRALPLTIMGVLSLMGGVAFLFLPETLNQPLPQTLGDGEMFGRDFQILSCVERQTPQKIRDDV